MICTTIQYKNCREIVDILSSGAVEMAEIRLDRCQLTAEDVRTVFSSFDIPLVATCRYSECPRQESLLSEAISSGANYADIEMETPAPVAASLKRLCREQGVTLIRSYHDFEGTPSAPELKRMAGLAFSKGAGIVKIAVTPHSEADLAAIRDLYGTAQEGAVIAFGMGEKGKASRLEALALGAPFTYAALDGEPPAAPGQWETSVLAAALYGPKPGLRRSGREAPSLTMPSSKSFAQRAVIAAALSDGESTLTGYTPCDDNRSALAVARALGAEIQERGNILKIKGISASPLCLRKETVHTGESGFLTRLMIPLLAVLSDRPVTVTGEKTLLRRPLSLAHDIMASFGVRLYSDAKAPRKEDCMLPLTVKGPLYPGRAEVSGQGGSQLISGLLAALPLCGTDSVLIVESPKSLPYLFITTDVLKQFGIKVSARLEGEADFAETMDWDLCSEVRFDIKGGQRYHPASFRIEADWSGAAAFLVAGAVFGELNLRGLDTSTTQADLAILDILSSAGACISQIDDGPTPSTGTIHVERSPLSAVSVSLDHCPDLFPQVAVMAAFCSGTSRLSGADRLRHKETDRAAAIIGMLNSFGVPAGLDGGVMVIEGMSLSRRLATGNLLKGGKFSSLGDHRMVMALKVASLGADSAVEIDDINCVAKSYPGFPEDFAAVEQSFK